MLVSLDTLSYHHTLMGHDLLRDAIKTVPAGPWAVAVSGGADSVALLRLLHERPDLHLHVVHLDHETRDGESAVDAKFVLDLSGQLGLACMPARRTEIEATMTALPANPSARFRAVRMELFRRAVDAHHLKGVVLAHHADDQAETILQRLLRGAGATGLAGMSPTANLAGLMVLRPLLEINAVDLRQYLANLHQLWREDSSNTSPKYFRNRLRPLLAGDPELKDGLLRLGRACMALRQWLESQAPRLTRQFGVDELASLPTPLARQSARRWLKDRGSPAGEINPPVCERLIEMARDAASPSRQYFPGRVGVCRRRGKIFVEGD